MQYTRVKANVSPAVKTELEAAAGDEVVSSLFTPNPKSSANK
jgi:hypothetical protein